MVRVACFIRTEMRRTAASPQVALVACCAALGAVVCGAGAAAACSVDGVPSLSVNGRLVALNTAQPGAATFAAWTPFVARGRYSAHRPLLLREDRAKVAQALAPSAFRFPWRWDFGDGATARGWSVRHVYRHPGTYIISVATYLVAGKQKQWYTFDKASIQVR